MTFTLKIHIVNGELQGVAFDDMAQPVTVVAALRAADAAKAALLDIEIAKPATVTPPPSGDA
jgi:hypothetical protein